MVMGVRQLKVRWLFQVNKDYRSYDKPMGPIVRRR